MKYRWILALAAIAACTPAEDWSEIQYIQPAPNGDISCAGECVQYPLEACWFADGDFLALVQITSVSSEIPNDCDGNTRAHRVVQFRTVEPIEGDATSGAFRSAVTSTPLSPGERAFVKLIEMPSGEYVSAMSMHVLPADADMPSDWVEMPSRVSTSLDVAISEIGAATTCNPPFLPEPAEVVEFYLAPDPYACAVQ